MIDLHAAFQDGMRQMHAKGTRGDEHLVHIGGDLAGLCDRASWARRRYHQGKKTWDGKKWVNAFEAARPADPDVANATAMQLGFKAEELMLDALRTGLPEGYTLETGIGAALVLSDPAKIQGHLFHGADVDGQMIDFAQLHSGVAIGHIDALVSNAVGDELYVLDAKSTVWGDKYATGNRVWSPWGPPKEQHEVQVASYALAVALANPDALIGAFLLELDLGGKDTRLSSVAWQSREEQIRMRLISALEFSDPEGPEPPAHPLPWTVSDSGISWACGGVKWTKNGPVVKRGYCPQTSCPAHVAQATMDEEVFL